MMSIGGRASASLEAASVDLGCCLLEAYVLSWEPWCERGEPVCLC